MENNKNKLVHYFIMCGYKKGEALRPFLDISNTSMTSSTTWMDNSYKGMLLLRYPEMDFKDGKLPPHAWMFCMPRGLKFSKSKLSPSCFSFASTAEDGSRFYGVNLTFYEEIEIY